MAIKDEWCSCTRLRDAEEKAAKWDGIVRCVECRWYTKGEKHGCTRYWVKRLLKSLFYYPIMDVEPDGFCAWGERRQS